MARQGFRGLASQWLPLPVAQGQRSEKKRGFPESCPAVAGFQEKKKITAGPRNVRRACKARSRGRQRATWPARRARDQVGCEKEKTSWKREQLDPKMGLGKIAGAYFTGRRSTVPRRPCIEGGVQRMMGCTTRARPAPQPHHAMPTVTTTSKSAADSKPPVQPRSKPTSKGPQAAST